MYETIGGYYDCFPCEKKHRAYKTCLADDLQNLWKSQTGDLSLHVLCRMLLETVQAQKQQLHAKPVLQGQVWPPEKVERVAGIPGTFSTRMHTRYGQLSKDDVIFWNNDAGRIVLFADYKSQMIVVLECMLEVKCNKTLQRSFRFTGSTEAIRFDDLQGLRRPSWWCIDGADVLCLL